MSEVNSVLNLNMNKSKGPGESRVQGSDAAKPCMSLHFMIERGTKWHNTNMNWFWYLDLEQSRKARHYNVFKALGVGAEWIIMDLGWALKPMLKRRLGFEIVFSRQNNPGKKECDSAIY